MISANRQELDNYVPSMSVSIQDKRSHTSTDIQDISQTDKYTSRSFTVTYNVNSSDVKTNVKALRTNTTAINVVDVVKEFRNISNNNLFDESIIEVVQEFMTSELSTNEPFVYAMDLNASTIYDVTFVCDVIAPYSCSVHLSKSLKTTETFSTRHTLSESRLENLLRNDHLTSFWEGIIS